MGLTQSSPLRREDPSPDRSNSAAPSGWDGSVEGLGELASGGLDFLRGLFGLGSGCEADMAEAEAFVAGGKKGPIDVPGPGGYGGFTAEYDPLGGSGLLAITQSVAVDFKDVLVSSGGTISPHPDLPVTPEITALAARISAMPEPERSTALADYQWPDAEKTPGSPWLTQLESVVESMWSGQHTFFVNKPMWDWIGARVGVDLSYRISTDGKKLPDEHMYVETFRTPQGESLRTFDISHNVGVHDPDDARDETMRLSSTAVGPKEYELLTEHIQFEQNSSELSGAAETSLRSFIRTFDGDVTHAAHQEVHVDLVAHASSEGSDDYNMRLAERRAAAVRKFLDENGFHNVSTRIAIDARGEREADQSHAEPGDRRVDLVVDGGARMITAAHEWGHSFGLDDEYGTVGETTDHNAWTQDMTDSTGANLPGAIREHNGGIMSFGNEVRPQHYSTFHHALETVTGVSPWSLGTAKPKASVASTCGPQGGKA